MKKSSNRVYRLQQRTTTHRVDGKKGIAREVTNRTVFEGTLDALVRRHPLASDPPPREYTQSAGLPCPTLIRVVQIWDKAKGWQDCDHDPRRTPSCTNH